MSETETVGLPEYLIFEMIDDASTEQQEYWKIVGRYEADGKDAAIDAYHEAYEKREGKEVPEGVVLNAVAVRNWGVPEKPVRYKRIRER